MIESDLTSHAKLKHHMSQIIQVSMSAVNHSKPCPLVSWLCLGTSWYSPSGSLLNTGDGERLFGFFMRYGHSFDMHLTNASSLHMCSDLHSLVFMHSSFAHMFPTHISTHPAEHLATGNVSHSVTLTHEHSPIVGTTSWGCPIRHQEQTHLAERYVVPGVKRWN